MKTHEMHACPAPVCMSWHVLACLVACHIDSLLRMRGWPCLADECACCQFCLPCAACQPDCSGLMYPAACLNLMLHIIHGRHSKASWLAATCCHMYTSC
jgi:hypothetical protein